MASPILQKISNLFTILKIFYIYSIISAIKSYLQTKTFDRCVSIWSLMICKLFKIKIHQIKSTYKLRRQKTMFLANHRSQADFFIHSVLTGGDVNYLARRQVAIMFGIVSFFIQRRIWFFNRSSVDIEKFNSWVDKKFQQSTAPSLIVYPEGHRMYGTQVVQKQKVKRGMIKYAYTRNIPVQFLMTFGNQNVLNQKKLKIGYNQQVKYKVGKTLHPQDFKDSKQFVDAAVQQFIRFFGQTLNDTQNNTQSIDKIQQLLDALTFKKQ